MTHTKDEALNRALEALEWMVANDDTNEGDEPVERLGGQSWNEYNAYWLDGLNKARASITAIKQALAAPAVQDPVAWWVTQMDMDRKIDSFAVTSDYDYAKSVCDLDIATPRPLIFGDTTPPAQPVVPDAMTSADIQEHIEYVAGWNDCRQAMLEMMKARTV